MPEASNKTPELEFEAKLQAAIATSASTMKLNRLKSDTAINHELKKLSLDSVSIILLDLTELMGLDTEKMEFMISKHSRRSEYGRISELITQIAKLYAWPIESIADAKEIDNKQEEIIDYFKAKGMPVTHDLLLDIKESKGNHAFLDQASYEIVTAVEPEYDELHLYLRTFAEYVGLPIIDYKLTQTRWNSNEMKAQRKITLEHDAAQEALSKHKELETA